MQKNNENPVYYCQYAHARICSILRKARQENIYPNYFKNELIRKLVRPEELDLIKKMADFPELLINIVDKEDLIYWLITLMNFVLSFIIFTIIIGS